MDDPRCSFCGATHRDAPGGLVARLHWWCRDETWCVIRAFMSAMGTRAPIR